MNFAVGCDIEQICRFENKFQDVHFLNEIFTSNEQEYCLSKAKPAQHLAARYCGKEAVVKALYGVGIENIFYKDIEITKSAKGVPEVSISQLPDIKIKISLSHCQDYAMAQVIVFKDAI